MRIVKDPDERKSEIMDTAQKLFVTKGYKKTTIIDILEEVGIAKGTFYYYFKSKEEIMDAIILRVVEANVAKAQMIAAEPDMTALDKFFKILATQSFAADEGSKERMAAEFHQPSNAEMHQKSIVQSILKLTPVLTEVIRQGIEEHTLHVEYPKETTEFLLVAGQIIFDKGFFQWEEADIIQKVKAFIHIMEITLGAEKGSFAPMQDILLG